MATNPRDTYITGLVNAHALEEQAVSLLSRQVERLESYPEMSDQIRLHIDEFKAQAQRLEEILNALGTSHSTSRTSSPPSPATWRRSPTRRCRTR